MNKKILIDCYAELSAEGFGLILLRKPEKPSKHWPKGRGKEPMQDGWPDLGVENAVTARLEGYNIGLKISRHVIMDWDPRNGDPRAEFAPLEMWEQFPRVLTPGGGIHYYMRAIEGIPHGRPGMDVKAAGSQVLAPYCVHPNGGMYEWDLSSPPLGLIVDMPKWLIMSAPVTFTPQLFVVPPDTLATALQKIDPCDFRDHEKWFRMMCACHEATGGLGLSQFLTWSTEDILYASDAEQITYRWNSLGKKSNGNRAGLGTLNRLLIAAGGEGIANPIPTEFADMAVDLIESAVAIDLKITNPVGWLTESGHCIVGNGGKTYAAYRRHGEWCFSTRFDFLIVCQTEYGLKQVTIPPKREGDAEKSMPAGKFWFDFAKKPVYSGIGYEPDITEVRPMTSDGKLNTWTGFGVVSRAGGDWSLLRELMIKTACRGDMELYNYLINWMATVVQNPGRPCGVALVLQSHHKGTGKTTIASRFMKLFGRHALAVTSKEQLLGRFNAHLEGKSLIVASEAFWAGSKAGESVLKSLITDTDVTYERKGMTPYQGRNCVNMMINSNEEWVVPASMDERRFCVLDFDEEKRSRIWWDKLHADLNTGGLEAFMYHLMSIGLDGFAIQDMPATEGLVKQKMLSMNLVEQWLYEIADAGDWAVMGCIAYKHASGQICYLASDVIGLFTERFDRRCTISPTSFGMQLKRLAPGIKKVQIANPHDVIISGPPRVWAYIMPPVVVVREQLGLLS